MEGERVGHGKSVLVEGVLIHNMLRGDIWGQLRVEYLQQFLNCQAREQGISKRSKANFELPFKLISSTECKPIRSKAVSTSSSVAGCAREQNSLRAYALETKETQSQRG